jgi:hypothetical protein
MTRTLVDRALRRHTAVIAGVTFAGARLARVDVITASVRGRVFATQVFVGRAAIVVGLLPAIEQGVHDQVVAGPTRVRWLRRAPGPTGAMVLLWDGTSRQKQNNEGGPR